MSLNLFKYVCHSNIVQSRCYNVMTSCSFSLILIFFKFCFIFYFWTQKKYSLGDCTLYFRSGNQSLIILGFEIQYFLGKLKIKSNICNSIISNLMALINSFLTFFIFFQCIMSKLYTVVEIVRVFYDNDGKVFWRMRNGAYVPLILSPFKSLFKSIPVFSMVTASIYIKKVRVIIL